MVSKYTIPDYDKDIDYVLDYNHYRKCLYKIDLAWLDSSQRTDIIALNKEIHPTELNND